jgi:hypothetical protein
MPAISGTYSVHSHNLCLSWFRNPEIQGSCTENKNYGVCSLAELSVDIPSAQGSSVDILVPSPSTGEFPRLRGEVLIVPLCIL